jgi:hypothetical protein
MRPSRTRIRGRFALLLAAVGLALVGGAAALAATLAFPIKSPPAIQTEFGYIKSLVRKGASYQLRINPAFFLQGETANAAAVAAGEIKPGEGVPDDYFIVRVPARVILTYKVPANVPVTVLSNRSRSMRITVGQLARILKGTSPLKSRLLDTGPKFFLGYWLRFKVDTVISIDQQFQP